MSKHVKVVTQLEKYRTVVNANGHFLIVDEPKELNGKDLGPTPGQLFATSLATCTSITVKMYADRKGWDLQEVSVEVDFERDTKQNVTNVSKKIHFKGNLDEDQKSRLLEISKRCPIHLSMINPIEINSELI